MSARSPLSATLLILAGALSACGGSKSTPPQPAPSAEFSNPQQVTIQGYTGDAMEPFLSLDGTTLFFNNLNTAADTNLYYAQKVDALTFQYKGPVAAANTTQLDGVPSMDQNGKFYFISTPGSYFTDLSTVYQGDWSHEGTLSNVTKIAGIPSTGLPMVIFDVGISADGNTLCLSEGDYSNSVLNTSNLVLADKTATGFTRSPQSATILQQVNLAGGTQYAPAFSADGLELYFTRLVGGLQAGAPSIFVATRASTTSAFGAPHAIQALTGFVEAPSLSVDGKSLYYHAKVSGQFQIYRATRP
jgi:hypothetical protein